MSLVVSFLIRIDGSDARSELIEIKAAQDAPRGAASRLFGGRHMQQLGLQQFVGRPVGGCGLRIARIGDGVRLRLSHQQSCQSGAGLADRAALGQVQPPARPGLSRLTDGGSGEGIGPS